MNYTKHNILFTTDLRAICIAHNFYTRGDNEDYENLFHLLRDDKGNMREATDELIQALAEDIKAHSDTEFSVLDIMNFIVQKRAVWYGEE